MSDNAETDKLEWDHCYAVVKALGWYDDKHETEQLRSFTRMLVKQRADARAELVSSDLFEPVVIETDPVTVWVRSAKGADLALVFYETEDTVWDQGAALLAYPGSWAWCMSGATRCTKYGDEAKREAYDRPSRSGRRLYLWGPPRSGDAMQQ